MKQFKDMPEFVTVKQLAEFLKVSKGTIYNMIKDGELKAVKVHGSVFRISRDYIGERFGLTSAGEEKREMIKVSGCCDGCGKEADRRNISELFKVPLVINDEVAEFDFCEKCMYELGTLPGGLADQIHELQRRHGC